MDIYNDWDEIHKRSQLTFWILFALHDGERYSAEIIDFMSESTKGSFQVQEQSMQRALRRFRSLKLIVGKKKASPSAGPSRNYYLLTDDGSKLLKLFCQKSLQIYLYPENYQKIQRIIKENV